MVTPMCKTWIRSLGMGTWGGNYTITELLSLSRTFFHLLMLRTVDTDRVSVRVGQWPESSIRALPISD